MEYGALQMIESLSALEQLKKSDAGIGCSIGSWKLLEIDSKCQYLPYNCNYKIFLAVYLVRRPAQYILLMTRGKKSGQIQPHSKQG